MIHYKCKLTKGLIMRTKLLATALLVTSFLQAAITDIRVEANGVPAFIGRSNLSQGKVYCTSDKTKAIETLTLQFDGKFTNISKIRLGDTVGKINKLGKVTFQVPVKEGPCEYTLYIEPAKKANLLDKIILEGVPFRIGSLVTSPRQEIIDVGRKSKNFRIPGIVETPDGTLVAVFDNRFNHAGDLPADITVGVSISTDKGTTWSPIRTAIDCEGLPGGQGIGDPTILVDPSNGRIWVAALRAPKTGHPIWKSEKGTTSPDKCGQFILAYSDNNGKTWSKPINITEDIKRLQDPDTAEWALLFQGPGAGIAMKDGTLVFPAQVWGHHGKAPHHGVLVYSKDHGKTWTSSKAMTWGGSESTVAELPDGSLIFNTREGGGPRTRITAITKDMGETWTKLETDPLRQPGNLCQAAYLAINGDLYFSNPNSGKRDTMTLRKSTDGGKTWPTSIVYDPRACAGYSSLCPVENNSIGVIYEGQSDYHYFLRIPLEDLK